MSCCRTQPGALHTKNRDSRKQICLEHIFVIPAISREIKALVPTSLPPPALKQTGQISRPTRVIDGVFSCCLSQLHNPHPAAPPREEAEPGWIFHVLQNPLALAPAHPKQLLIPGLAETSFCPGAQTS